MKRMLRARNHFVKIKLSIILGMGQILGLFLHMERLMRLIEDKTDCFTLLKSLLSALVSQEQQKY